MIGSRKELAVNSYQAITFTNHNSFFIEYHEKKNRFFQNMFLGNFPDNDKCNYMSACLHTIIWTDKPWTNSQQGLL